MKMKFLTKKMQNWQHCKNWGPDQTMIVGFGISNPKLGKYTTFLAVAKFLSISVVKVKLKIRISEKLEKNPLFNKIDYENFC